MKQFKFKKEVERHHTLENRKEKLWLRKNLILKVRIMENCQ
jgi:hypothetical protein